MDDGENEIIPIRFSATIAKVQTLVDGGLRITLDLPETAIEQASKIMQAKQAGAILEIAAIPVDATKKKNGRTKPRRIRKSTLYATRAEETNPEA